MFYPEYKYLNNKFPSYMYKCPPPPPRYSISPSTWKQNNTSNIMSFPLASSPQLYSVSPFKTLYIVDVLKLNLKPVNAKRILISTAIYM